MVHGWSRFIACRLFETPTHHHHGTQLERLIEHHTTGKRFLIGRASWRAAVFILAGLSLRERA